MECYGLVEQGDISERDKVLITEMIQYIYDHCSENITLETLSKVFYLSPSILSKKLRKQICVDFRIFVNDIRIHKAVRMMEAPKNRKKKIEDIAILCAFNSMSTFYRCYKRNYGFRRMRAAEENVEL
jgi:YesN/AraC family two-component response regulator